MKFNAKILSVFTLAVVFVLSSLVCCCFADTARTNVPNVDMPSCHQANQDTASSDESPECACDQSQAIVKTGDVFSALSAPLALINIDRQIIDCGPAVFKTQSCQAPLPYYDPQPLYIQYSVYRI